MLPYKCRKKCQMKKQLYKSYKIVPPNLMDLVLSQCFGTDANIKGRAHFVITMYMKIYYCHISVSIFL